VVIVAAHGCSLPDLSSDNTLTRLQIMSVIVEPPLVRPGDVPSVTAWVSDPTDEGYEILVWTCTNLGRGCVETDLDIDLWTDTPLMRDGASEPWIPDIDTNGMPSDLELPVSVLALACAPGLCPEIGEVRRGDPNVGAVLSDPTEFARSLPIDGTSLVRRGATLTGDVEGDNDNPDVQMAPDPDVRATPGEEVRLSFRVSDETDMTSDGFATGGVLEDGIWTGHDLLFIWNAPEKTGDYELWVTIEDGTGGGAVWRGIGQVR
jgi:hypothetical protein